VSCDLGASLHFQFNLCGRVLKSTPAVHRKRISFWDKSHF